MTSSLNERQCRKTRARALRRRLLSRNGIGQASGFACTHELEEDIARAWPAESGPLKCRGRPGKRREEGEEDAQEPWCDEEENAAVRAQGQEKACREPEEERSDGDSFWRLDEEEGKEARGLKGMEGEGDPLSEDEGLHANVESLNIASRVPDVGVRDDNGEYCDEGDDGSDFTGECDSWSWCDPLEQDVCSMCGSEWSLGDYDHEGSECSAGGLPEPSSMSPHTFTLGTNPPDTPLNPPEPQDSWAIGIYGGQPSPFTPATKLTRPSFASILARAPTLPQAPAPASLAMGPGLPWVPATASNIAAADVNGATGAGEEQVEEEQWDAAVAPRGLKGRFRRR